MSTKRVQEKLAKYNYSRCAIEGDHRNERSLSSQVSAEDHIKFSRCIFWALSHVQIASRDHRNPDWKTCTLLFGMSRCWKIIFFFWNGLMDWNTWKKNIWKIVVMIVFLWIRIYDKDSDEEEDAKEHMAKYVEVPVPEPVFYIRQECIRRWWRLSTLPRLLKSLV